MPNENEATIWDDDAEIQPEGGLTEADFYGPSEFEDDALDKLFAQESEAAAETEDEKDETDGADEKSPTTETVSEAAENAEDEEDAPTTEPEPDLPRKLKFRVKYDHNEQDVELDESELPTLYQTAQNFDRLSKKYDKVREENRAFKALAAQLGYESVQDMIEKSSQADRDSRIEELVNGGTSKEIAEDYIDRKIKSAKEKAHKNDADDDGEHTPSSEPKPAQQDANDYFRAQVEDFFKARPDLKGKVKTLPKEVSEAVVLRKGTLREIYAEWEAKQQKADADKNRKERERFAKQAEAATRAPVRAAPEANTDKGQKPDPFLKGFNDDGETWHGKR